MISDEKKPKLKIKQHEIRFGIKIFTKIIKLPYKYFNPFIIQNNSN